MESNQSVASVYLGFPGLVFLPVYFSQSSAAEEEDLYVNIF